MRWLIYFENKVKQGERAGGWILSLSGRIYSLLRSQGGGKRF